MQSTPVTRRTVVLRVIRLVGVKKYFLNVETSSLCKQNLFSWKMLQNVYCTCTVLANLLISNSEQKDED